MLLNKIDRNAQELLDELRLEYQIEFEASNINYCQVTQKGRKATIQYNPKTFNSESIVHELLHIWLDRYNYKIGNYVYLICRGDKNLSKVFLKPLCDHIENCFDHFKMYPKYIAMGYSAEGFMIDSLKEKCSIKDIDLVRTDTHGLHHAISIKYFIGYLISIYADHANNDYTVHLDLLSQKDHDLFEIVTRFWKSWLAFDITKIDSIENSDIELCDNFLDEINSWIKKGVVIF